MTIPTLFLFILARLLRTQNSETTKAKNLKCGDINLLICEVVHPHFWRRYVMWFGADAPKTCDSEV